MGDSRKIKIVLCPLFAGPGFHVAGPAPTGSRAAYFAACRTGPPCPAGAVLQVGEVLPRAHGSTLRGTARAMLSTTAVVPMVGHADAPALTAPLVHAGQPRLGGRNRRNLDRRHRNHDCDQPQSDSAAHPPAPRSCPTRRVKDCPIPRARSIGACDTRRELLLKSGKRVTRSRLGSPNLGQKARWPASYKRLRGEVPHRRAGRRR